LPLCFLTIVLDGECPSAQYVDLPFSLEGEIRLFNVS
jgi:hypothetical protein